MEDDSYHQDTADHHGVDYIPVNHADAMAATETYDDPDDDDLPTGQTGEPEFDSHYDNDVSIHEDPDETVHPDPDDQDAPSRPESSASHSMKSFEGDGAESSSHHGTEDDVFSDRSPRSSIHSIDGHYGDDAIEEMTEKGDETPDVRSRVTSGVSMSDASAVSDLSRLSCYDQEDFVPTSRSNRPAFRSPSSVRAIQVSSPTPSIYSSSARSAKRHSGLPTVSRVGSPSASAQYSSRGRSTPSRFRRPEPAPLVLLHVTLLPLRWVYGGVVNHFESKKIQPISFSCEGLKNLRGAWRQLQDRLGDTEMERGILLPHPQNDYEVLEERLLEALELPLRRRARILECGHYLGPSNEMTIQDDIEDDFDDISGDEDSDPVPKKEKRHWCKSCKGDIKYQELGSERVFRIKVYASNGLMSAGAWEACWREMERVDIEVEPIVNSAVQQDLAKLAASFEQDQRKQLDQQSGDGQQLQLEAERRQKFEEQRQLLEAQRREFEEQRQQLEDQRNLIEQEQHQHLEDARRQELEDEHKVLDQQRQQLEDARQQFEEERRQRLEEEELRRMQRDDDEQKQPFPSRTMSRASNTEDDLASPGAETITSPDIDGRPRDSERLREIYGDHTEASSEGIMGGSSTFPSEDAAYSGQTQAGTHHTDSYSSPPPPSEQAYQPHEGRRRSLDNASLPELLGETIRIGLQDPKNVAILVLVVLMAILAGQFTTHDERGIELYKPQPQTSYQHHQIEAGELIPQLDMDTAPAIHYTETTPTASKLVETIYKTVVESSTSTVTEPSTSSASLLVETVYETVTQSPIDDTSSRSVETVFTTVTESLVEPSAPSTTEASNGIAATEVASELTPSSADPSIDLSPEFTPLPFCWWADEEIHRNSSSSLIFDGGFDVFAPSPFPEPATEPEARSNEEISKTTFEESEIGTEVDHNASFFNPTCLVDDREPNLSAQLFEAVENEFSAAIISLEAFTSEPETVATTTPLIEERASKKEAARTTIPSTTFTRPTPQTSSVSSITSATATKGKRTVRVYEVVTETVLVTATRTRSAVEMTMTSRRATPKHADALSEEMDDTVEDGDEILRETLIETVKVTSTVEVDWPEATCDALGPYTSALWSQDNYGFL